MLATLGTAESAAGACIPGVPILPPTLFSDAAVARSFARALAAAAAVAGWPTARVVGVIGGPGRTNGLYLAGALTVGAGLIGAFDVALGATAAVAAAGASAWALLGEGGGGRWLGASPAWAVELVRAGPTTRRLIYIPVAPVDVPAAVPRGALALVAGVALLPWIWPAAWISVVLAGVLVVGAAWWCRAGAVDRVAVQSAMRAVWPDVGALPPGVGLVLGVGDGPAVLRGYLDWRGANAAQVVVLLGRGVGGGAHSGSVAERWGEHVDVCGGTGEVWEEIDARARVRLWISERTG